MRITFILPGIEMHGGVKSTFEIANLLVEHRHRVSVIHPLVPIRNGASVVNARRFAARTLGLISNIRRGKNVEWFDLRAELISVPIMNERFIPPSDIIIATWWANAYDMYRYDQDKGRKFYFRSRKRELHRAFTIRSHSTFNRASIRWATRPATCRRARGPRARCCRCICSRA